MPPSVNHYMLHFSGHVQGVGFRYATLQVAREFEVAGYVKNLADGRVLLEAEGSRPELEAFVVALQERMHGYIRNIERVQQMRAPSFHGFELR